MAEDILFAVGFKVLYRNFECSDLVEAIDVSFHNTLASETPIPATYTGIIAPYHLVSFLFVSLSFSPPLRSDSWI